jgi:hypothetical protein
MLQSHCVQTLPAHTSAVQRNAELLTPGEHRLGGEQRGPPLTTYVVALLVDLVFFYPDIRRSPMRQALIATNVLLTLVPDPLRRSVGDPHADRSETSFKLSFRAGAPDDGVQLALASMSSAGIDKVSGTCL